MKDSLVSNKNDEVEGWWEKNPFTWGISDKSTDLVGKIDFEKMDLHYFDEVDRKFRKHTRGGSQDDGAPLFSKLLKYEWFKGKKVLDIAVGSGFSMVAFIKGGGQVTGIDITDFAVQEARRNLAVRGLTGEVIKMDAQKMSFPDESFDFVSAWGCLMHMPDTEKAVSEIYRVVRPQGKVFAYMYNRSSWPFWFNLIFLRGILMGKLITYRFDIDRLTSRYSDGFSVGGNMLAKFYSPRQAATIFKKAGFSKVRSFPLDLPYEPSGWPVRRFPVFKYLPKSLRGYMSKRWGYGLMVIGEK
ncbi:MAG: hypothetical protein COV91_00790 [Candidatus Taylorbacteria bacterium CG11_big_fil_rev_8_21_14_0_20_46_11]|uniref:Methyltransferase type 11 domain-containing protein n=1 Tax=Candidatus Taylorbacteria bacterium CG11_big_fil_rev_8_21_14_0_20_46_11 TaxID=1975025 RepID=A0A2H0KCL3_9BACT|nr:MAG: hypothetical protein COV91_00790 [Candidatus Taylorbacteria bacterium CG11_big_fil_rev_8_21_14_0_20_46_11]